MKIDIQPEIWYPCPLCGTVFVAKSFLMKHYKEWHISTNENAKDFTFNFNLPKELKRKEQQNENSGRMEQHTSQC